MFNDQGVSDLGRLVYFITLPSLLFVNILREVGTKTTQPSHNPSTIHHPIPPLAHDAPR